MQSQYSFVTARQYGEFILRNIGIDRLDRKRRDIRLKDFDADFAGNSRSHRYNVKRFIARKAAPDLSRS